MRYASKQLFHLATQGMKKNKIKAAQVKSDKTQSPVERVKDGSLRIRVSARPGSKANAISGVEEDGIVVHINAPPVEGEANLELIKFIAYTLGLKKSSVSLDRGSKSRQKTLLITDSDFTEESLLRKLKECVEK